MRRRERGMSFVEVLAVTAIVAILASAILPLARVTRQRQRELELRRVLRELRGGIDRFKDGVDRGQIGGTDVKLGSEGYPESLETLVEEPDKRRVILRWGLFGLALLGAALLTPHGLDGLLYPFVVMQMTSLTVIGEWRPTNFAATPTFGFAS